MSESATVPDGGAAPRLRELEVLTREYASYSTTAFGMGYVAWGLWLAASAVACLLAPAWGPNLAFLAAPAWYPVMHLARRRYQARGRVLACEAGTRGPRVARLFGLLMLASFGMQFVARILRHRQSYAASQGDVATVAVAVGVASAVATLLLAVALSRGYRDTIPPIALFAVWTVFADARRILPRDWEEAIGPAVLLGGVGLFLAVLGGWQHDAWVKLDRRLAELREAP